MATYRDVPLLERLILKFSTVVPGNQMAMIEKLAERLNLKIESISDEAHLKVIHITGNGARLAAMDQELVRHASISKKIISSTDKSAVIKLDHA